MQKGTSAIRLGCALVAFQVLSYIASAITGDFQIIRLSFDSLPLFLKGLAYTLCYNILGLFGLDAIRIGVMQNKRYNNSNCAQPYESQRNTSAKTQENIAKAWIYCPNCGGAWEQQENKCLICNHVSTSLNPPLRFCPDCGTYLEEDGSCPVCGHTVLDK